MFFMFRLLLRRPKLLLVIGGIIMFGYGLKGVVEGISNPSAKTVTISQIESRLPDSGWYHITGGQLDLSQAVALDKNNEKPTYGEPATCIVAPLFGPSETTGQPRIFVKSTDSTLVAEAGQTGASKAVDVSGMIETGNDINNVVSGGPSLAGAVNSGGGNAIVLDDGRAPGSILVALLLLVLGLGSAVLGVAMMTGLEVPFLDSKGYEWSAENYKEKTSSGTQRPAGYPAPGYPAQGSYPVQPSYPQQPIAPEEAQPAPKMKSMDV